MALGVLALGAPALAGEEADAFGAAAALLQQRCAVAHCHAGPEPRMKMDLAPDRVIASTVGIASRTDPDVVRVAPGRPEASLLYLKLLPKSEAHYGGDRMPLHDRPLAPDELQVVRSWILSIPTAATPPGVTPAPATRRTFQDTSLWLLPTTERLGKRGFQFRVAHRFRGSADEAGFDELFGIDTGAWVLLGFAFGLSPRWEVSLQHSTYLQQEEAYVKVGLLRQERAGVSLSLLGGGSYIREEGRANPASANAQIILARRFGPVSLLAVPSYASRTNYLDEADDRGTAALGLGGEWHIGKFAILGEWIGQVDGVRDAYQSASLGVGIRTARHVFQIAATNTRGAGTSLYLPGGDLDWGTGEFRLGFNLTRYFSIR
jgi:hypothetical protein